MKRFKWVAIMILSVMVLQSIEEKQAHAGIATLVVGSSAIDEYRLSKAATATIWVAGIAMAVTGFSLVSAAAVITPNPTVGVLAYNFIVGVGAGPVHAVAAATKVAQSAGTYTVPYSTAGYFLLFLAQSPQEQDQAMALVFKKDFPQLSLNAGATCLAQEVRIASDRADRLDTQNIREIPEGSTVKSIQLTQEQVSGCVSREDLSEEEADSLTQEIFKQVR